MRIGLLADTHLSASASPAAVLGPEAAEILSALDLLLHAGDVTSPAVLDWLEQFAPLKAARGNNDNFEDERLDRVQVLEVGGWRIGMVHSLVPETRPLGQLRAQHFPTAVDVMIGGHTHYERLEYRDGVLLVNPGSPNFPHNLGQRRGTMGLLELGDGTLHAEIVLLGETPGRANPGRALSLDVEHGRVVASSRVSGCAGGTAP